MPPSTSSRPSRSTGAKMPGADMLARSAVTRSPLPSTTASPVSRSVATARKRVGRWSKSVDVGHRQRQLAQHLRRVSGPGSGRCGSWNRPSRRPSGSCTRNSRSSRLRRKFRLGAWRPVAEARPASRRSRIHARFRRHVMPLAYSPPTTAPMLVPAIASTGTRSSSSTFSTPDVRGAARTAARQHEADRGVRVCADSSCAAAPDADAGAAQQQGDKQRQTGTQRHHPKDKRRSHAGATRSVTAVHGC